MTRLAGAVVWAVVPFVPEAPFRLYAGVSHEPKTVPSAAPLIQAARGGGDPQFSYLVAGKARPVLVVSDAQQAALGEYVALRLVTFSKLTEGERELVRAGEDRALVHLRPESFPGLPEENAAMVASLVRVHRSALEPAPLGRLNPQELAIVHERLAEVYALDLRMLVRHHLQRLAERQRHR